MSETRYARNGDVHLAYQILGDGPLELVFAPGTFIPIDSLDEHPLPARFIRRLASFAKVLVFDRRGVGASDPVSPTDLPTLELVAEDMAAIMEHAGFEQPAVVAAFDGSVYAMTLASLMPQRVKQLVLIHGFAKFLYSEDHPWGLGADAPESYKTLVEEGTTEELDILAITAPSVAADPRFRDWWDRAGRRGASPSLALALTSQFFTLDVRELLPTVSVPTTVIHKRDNRMIPIEEARYLADHLPQATLIELEGRDHLSFVDGDGVLDAIEEAVTGSKSAPADRVLATVLFTDIVDSTKLASELGDRKWRQMLDDHDQITRRAVERAGGRLIKTTGDGLLATFDGPGPAIRCTRSMRDELASSGLRIRAGIHTGEIEVRGDDVGGIAVHIAARVMGAAGDGEIIVSSVVPPLVVGSEFEFADRGARELKGVPGEWRVLSVEG